MAGRPKRAQLETMATLSTLCKCVCMFFRFYVFLLPRKPKLKKKKWGVQTPSFGFSHQTILRDWQPWLTHYCPSQVGGSCTGWYYLVEWRCSGALWERRKIFKSSVKPTHDLKRSWVGLCFLCKSNKDAEAEQVTLNARLWCYLCRWPELGLYAPEKLFLVYWYIANMLICILNCSMLQILWEQVHFYCKIHSVNNKTNWNVGS